MLHQLPLYLSIGFVITALATLLLFVAAIRQSNDLHTQQKAPAIAMALLAWLILQAVLSLQQVYSTGNNRLPPTIALLGFLPMLITIVALFATRGGRAFIDILPLQQLTYLNVVRVPVEIVLLGLYTHKVIPQLMTFEGRNFDIIAGITAPFVAYYGVAKGMLHRRLLLLWHCIGLGLLLNIVVHALLSAPSPIQQFAFDQPNIAILYFPFSWLPTFIVPVVLFGHLVAIRQLTRRNIAS